MYSMDQKRLEFPFISRKHMQNLYTINQALVEKLGSHTEQKKKFFIKDFFVKCDQIRRNWGFGHVYWKIIYEKLHFFCAVLHGNSFNKHRPWKKVNSFDFLLQNVLQRLFKCCVHALSPNISLFHGKLPFMLAIDT